MKALIIDNSSDTIELVSLCFKLRWPNVDIAISNTGEHGVELVELERPDIVILDIGGNGLDKLTSGWFRLAIPEQGLLCLH